MKKIARTFFLVLFVGISSFVFAQTTITGKITDKKTHCPL